MVVVVVVDILLLDSVVMHFAVCVGLALKQIGVQYEGPERGWYLQKAEA